MAEENKKEKVLHIFSVGDTAEKRKWPGEYPKSVQFEPRELREVTRAMKEARKELGSEGDDKGDGKINVRKDK